MRDPIYSLELREERDVFAARQSGREVAAAVGLEEQDQVRIATALSEVRQPLRRRDSYRPPPPSAGVRQLETAPSFPASHRGGCRGIRSREIS